MSPTDGLSSSERNQTFRRPIGACQIFSQNFLQKNIGWGGGGGGGVLHSPLVTNIDEFNIVTNIDEFNNFFTRIGKEISNSIPNTTKQPEEYINYGRDIPDLNLGNTTAEQIIMISKELASKNSKDILGVTSKIIKFVIHQIS